MYTMRILLVLLSLAIHIFIYFVILRNLRRDPVIRFANKCIVMSNWACTVAFIFGYGELDSDVYTILSISLGIAWIMLCTSIVLLLIFILMGIAFGYFIVYRYIRILSAIAMTIDMIALAASLHNVREIYTPTQTIHINNLQQNLKIALITDLHINVLIDASEVKKVVEKVNAAEPDVILLGGDIVDATLADRGHNDTVREAILQLEELKSRYGTYYALGNHELMRDYQNLIAYMSGSNIQILQNDSVTIEEAGINIVGINDLITLRHDRFGSDRTDIEKAVHGIDPRYPTLLLSHQPRVVRELKSVRENIDLVLSGHTHGGQIFPFNLLVYVEQPFLKGLHRFDIDGMRSVQVFVSQGAGWWAMPMRLGSSREINILELTPEKDANAANESRETTQQEPSETGEMKPAQEGESDTPHATQ